MRADGILLTMFVKI